MSRHRIAAMRLRGSTGPLPVRVYWPIAPAAAAAAAPRPLVLFCAVRAEDEADSLCRELSSDADAVVLSVPCDPADPRDAIAALEWAAEHAAELSADPARLVVAAAGAGATVAALLVLHTREQGWPVIARQVLIDAGPARLRRAGAAAAEPRRSLNGPRADEYPPTASSYPMMKEERE